MKQDLNKQNRPTKNENSGTHYCPSHPVGAASQPPGTIPPAGRAEGAGAESHP